MTKLADELEALHNNALIAELTAERDAALAMVADLASELESELDAKGIYDTPRKMVRNRQTVVQARALLEGVI